MPGCLGVGSLASVLPLLATLLLGLRPTLSGPEQLRDTARFRVHYTLDGVDAPPHGPADADAAATGLDEVAARWIDVVGMRAPLDDGGQGGDGRIDVYLRRLDGARGLTHAEDVGKLPSASAWIELDPRTALVSPTRLAAAAGHEAHHAIQYAYSASLPAWIEEATAAWVEHADFTDPSLQAETDAHFAALLAHPEIPLDTVDGTHEYDELVFVKFMVDRARDPRVVRSLWEAMAARGDAMAGVAQAGGAPVAVLLVEFGEWNLHACAADDGAHYDPATAGCRSDVRASPPGVGVVPSIAPLPLAPYGIAWRSVPVAGCGDVVANLAALSPDLAWAIDGAGPPVLASTLPSLVAVGDGPRTFVLATDETAAPDLALELSKTAPTCAPDAGAGPSPPSGGCAIGGGPAAPWWLAVALALIVLSARAWTVAAARGGPSPPSPSAGRSTHRASCRASGAGRPGGTSA